ncbi:MAG: helix-turn-helix transcriptional regulator [Sphingomonadaceae bacterium]
MADRLLNRVRELREAEGWTQIELAERMGVSRKTVNTIENGIFMPSTIVALKMARALGKPVEEIFWLGRREPR